MLQVKNVKVYDLEESVIACRNAMRLGLPEYTEEEFRKSLERAKKLVKSSADSPNVKCHDNFLTGIRVSFDLVYPNYISPEMQRYHWFDIVTSGSKMHRISKMDFSKCCNEHVTKSIIDLCNGYRDLFNYIVENHVEEWTFCDYPSGPVHTTNYKDTEYKAFITLVSCCPQGVELSMRVSTNYKQLQTMYHQRKNHKLKEDWGAFCKFVEDLPYSKEFITG